MNKYKFTDYDLKYRHCLEKERGGKISDEEFYKYIQKLRRWMKKFMKVVKEWVEEKPWEAEQLSRLVDSWEEEKKNKKLYEKLAKIKKLPIAGLKKVLIPVLEKQQYDKLEFSKPEIDRDVIIKLTVQDNKEDREEYDSRSQLKKLLKQAIENTNWRLMSEGVYYKLGILTGKLRGYENDEDLLKLAVKSNKL